MTCKVHEFQCRRFTIEVHSISDTVETTEDKLADHNGYQFGTRDQ